jgi:hypothetical protein
MNEWRYFIRPRGEASSVFIRQGYAVAKLIQFEYNCVHIWLRGVAYMATKAQSDDSGKDNTSNGLKLIGEVVVPGASQFADGHIKSGSIHLLGALAAVALVGGPGGLLLSALIRGNSFTTSTLDKPIYKALFEKRAGEPAKPATT